MSPARCTALYRALLDGERKAPQPKTEPQPGGLLAYLEGM